MLAEVLFSDYSNLTMCTPSGRKRSKYSGSLEKGFLESLIREQSPRISLLTVQGKSDVWNHFKRILLDEEETRYVQCSECGNVMIHDNSTGTGGLKRHHCTSKASSNFPASFKASGSNNAGSVSISLNFPSKSLLPNPESLVTQLSREVAKAGALAVVKDFRSYDFMEGPGFEILAQSLINIGAKYGNVDVSLMLPSAIEVARNLEDVYLKIREVIRNELRNIKALGAACDSYIDEVNSMVYSTVSVRYFNNNQLATRVIGTFRIQEEDTSLILEEVNKIFNEFNLLKPVKICVTYNPISITRSPYIQYPWVSCAVSNINMVLKHALIFEDENIRDRINDTLFKCKLLVNYWNSDGSLAFRLTEITEDRYDTLVDMLESIEKHWNQLMISRKLNDELKNVIDSIDKELMIQIKCVLQPFKELRETLNDSREPTFHLVLPTKAKLLKKCEVSEMDDPFIIELKESLIESIESYFDVSIFHKCATILVPSFRSLKNMANSYERQEIYEMLKKLEEEYQTPKEVKRNGIENLFDSLVESNENVANHDYYELDRYLKDVFTSNEMKISPIEFWESRKNIYPCLYEVAKWLLSTPASSITALTNELIPINLLNSLNVENFNQILFIRANLK